MEDHIIELGSQDAIALGFTKDKFDGYLWRKGDYVVISFIVSRQAGQGNLSKLFETIESKGYGIKVPTPFTRMQSIIMKKGFKRTEEWFEEANCPVEVWVKPPNRVVVEKEGGKNEKMP